MLGAMGLDRPDQITVDLLHIRTADPGSLLHVRLESGQLSHTDCPLPFARPWALAQTGSFARAA